MPTLSASLRKAVIAITFLLVASVPCWAQTAASAQQPIRDAQAVAVVQNALAAMGGQAVIGQVRDSVVQGTIQPAEGTWLASGNLTWTTSGNEFRYDNPASNGRSILVSNGGAPKSSENSKVSNVPWHVTTAMFPTHLPAVALFQELQNPSYSISFIGNEKISGAPVLHVRTVLTSDEVTLAVTPQDWYFDASTFLPIQVGYRLPFESNALESAPGVVLYSNFKSVSGVLVPFQIATYIAGQLNSTILLQSVQFNTGPSPSEFSSPSGGGL